MKNDTLFFPGFHLPTLRRKPRSGAQKLAEEKCRLRRHMISQLGECFGSFIPLHELGGETAGEFSRRRIFSKENTFWAFFTQVLDADGGCREVVRKVQALACACAMPLPSASTSAYCQARSKLSDDGLKRILAHLRTVTAARPSWPMEGPSRCRCGWNGREHDLEFANGERRRFDMKPLLTMKPWNRIASPAIFNRARVDYGTVVWPGEIDIAPETLYEDSVPVIESIEAVAV